jgi:hypothetical protein
MTDLLRSLLNTSAEEGVVRISRGESARVAAANPGPGVPVSKLPMDARVQLMREGLNTSLKDFIASSGD